MSQKTIDRLEELLDQRDERIATLEETVEDLQARLECKTQWTEHLVDKECDDGGLPVPRLEITWHPMERSHDGYNMMIRYDLVKRHLCDEIHRVPLGATRTTATKVDRDQNGILFTPFRDGAHIAFDARELRLPAYVIDTTTGEHNRLKPRD